MSRPAPFRSRHSLVPATLAVALLASCLASSAAAVDTFYLRLFDDGRILAASGEPGQAADKLRLACFGMLEEPKALAPCLAHLLLALDAAEAATDDVEAVVDRLLEVEQRFRGWSEADTRFAPGPQLRGRVDLLLERYAAADLLARTPGYDAAALRKEAERVAALPPKERRKELNLWVQRQSDAVIWHVLSAELYLDEGEERAAVRAADEILTEFGDGTADSVSADDLAAARCVRGRARAGLGSCGPDVIEELELCAPNHRLRADVDEALALCLAQSDRWREALRALDRLPEERRERRELKRLQRQIEEALGEDSASLSATLAPEADGAEDRTRLAEPIHVPPPGVLATSRSSRSEGGSARRADEEPDVLERVRDALETERRDVYESLWPEARKAARRQDTAEAGRLAGGLAFRLSRWRDAIRYLGADEDLAGERPDLQLDLAIALYYEGRIDDARAAFELAKPALSASAWVGFWARELGSSG